MNFRTESVCNVLDTYGVDVSDDMIKDLEEALSMCDEYASYSTGGYNPQAEENRALKKALKREQDKQICGECKGNGYIFTPGPYHSSSSQCFKCNGSGYIYFD